MICFYYYLLIPTRIFLEKECRSNASSEGLGSIRKKMHMQNLKMEVLFLIQLIDMSKQFHKPKKAFIFSEKFGTVYFH
jgi:hypothetical protein